MFLDLFLSYLYLSYQIFETIFFIKTQLFVWRYFSKIKKIRLIHRTSTSELVFGNRYCPAILEFYEKR